MSPRPAHKFTQTLIGSAVAAAAIFTASAPAFAGNDPGRSQRTVEVRVADLDLTSQAGKARLAQRIKTASHTVCSPEPTRSLIDKMDYNSCVDVAQTGGKRAMVTLIAQAESGKKFAADTSIQVGN